MGLKHMDLLWNSRSPLSLHTNKVRRWLNLDWIASVSSAVRGTRRQSALDLVFIFIILNMIRGGGLVFIFPPCVPVRVGLFYWKACSYIPAWLFLTLFVSGESWVILRGGEMPSSMSGRVLDGYLTQSHNHFFRSCAQRNCYLKRLWYFQLKKIK